MCMYIAIKNLASYSSMYNVLLASYTSLKTKGGILVCYYYVEYKRTSIPVEAVAEGQQGTT